MEKKNIKEAEEQLKRVLLMMKYDSSKTLSENKEKIKTPINEVAPLLAAAAVIGGVGVWINNVMGGGDSFTKTKTFFDGCSTQFSGLTPTLDKSKHREAAETIYNAIAGLGTRKENIKSALLSMPTVADLCALNKWYTTTYGDLYDDLDSDIDGEDFRKYVWSAIVGQIEDAKEAIDKVPENKKIVNPPTIPPKPTVQEPCPVGDTEAVKKFQDWLDKNRQGWHDKYGVLSRNELRGYGKCGPRTRRWWASVKDQYLTTDTNTQQQDQQETNPYKDWSPSQVETGDVINKQTSDNNAEG